MVSLVPANPLNQMPYNPGVIDNSGAIRAQGMIQSSGMLSQNFGNLVDKWTQQQEQDKTLLAQAKATENFIKSQPELFGGQAAVDQALAIDPKVAPIARHAQLAQFVKDAIVGQKMKGDQQQIAQSQAATNQANAAAREADALAGYHQAQTGIMLKQQKALEDMIAGAHPDVVAKDTKDASGPQPVPFHAPTAPPPTRQSVARDLAISSRKMPTAGEIDTGYNAQYKNWSDVERPLGYVLGGTEENKDGKDTQVYYPVTIKNNGSILKGTSPVRVLANNPAPGVVLDEKNNYQPTATQPAIANQPIGPGQPVARPNYSSKAKVEMIDAADSIQKLTQAKSLIDKLDQINAQMKSKRWDSASGLTGNEFMNKRVEPMLGDQTGLAFDSLVSTLTGEVMANVKNIRNIFEFKAVTGSIPKSDMPYKTRQELLDAYREKVQTSLQRLQKGSQLLQSGVEPEDAWMQATGDSSKQEAGKATTAPTLQTFLNKYPPKK